MASEATQYTRSAPTGARHQVTQLPPPTLPVAPAIAEYHAPGLPRTPHDLRDALPVVAGPLIGARVRAAALRKPTEMVKVGLTPSSLRSTHAKEVAVWVGVERPAIQADGPSW